MINQEYVDDLANETMGLVWQEEYNIGNDMVDEQHQILFKIATEALILKATHDSSEKAKEELKNIIQSLFDYTVKHFHDEEIYMASISYPQLPAHKVRHHDILKAFEDFVKTMDDLSFEEIEDTLYEVIKAYFIEHITGMDNDIGVWVREQEKQA